MFETWYKMIALAQSGLDLTDLITHRISIDDFEVGFADGITGKMTQQIMRI
jgi:threonine 3-dehydrogenase